MQFTTRMLNPVSLKEYLKLHIYMNGFNSVLDHYPFFSNISKELNFKELSFGFLYLKLIPLVNM